MPTWDESKRRANIRRHKLDFAGIEVIWDGFTVTREDIRERYGERRFVTFGVLHDEVVVLVYTERRDDLHVISLRRADGANGLGGQGLVDDAADVIGLEDLGCGNEHAENSGAKNDEG